MFASHTSRQVPHLLMFQLFPRALPAGLAIQLTNPSTQFFFQRFRFSISWVPATAMVPRTSMVTAYRTAFPPFCAKNSPKRTATSSISPGFAISFPVGLAEWFAVSIVELARRGNGGTAISRNAIRAHAAKSGALFETPATMTFCVCPSRSTCTVAPTHDSFRGAAKMLDLRTRLR